MFKKSLQFSLFLIFIIGGALGFVYGIQPYITQNIKIQDIKKVESEKAALIFPSVKTIAPNDGARDVILDIEDPIVVNFNNSTDGFFINFVIEPYSEVVYENNPEKTQFKLLPRNKTLDNQKYIINIYAKYKNAGDETYVKIFESTFETLPPPPASWEKDLSLRVEQAKRFTRAQIKEGKYIDINLAIQIMSVFEQGKILDAFVISSGKRGMETPKGTFAIANKFNRPFSKGYGLYMPYWMALVPSGKFGIHELPEWPGGYKEGASHLGTPVSHGCVRLGVGAAKRVFDWAEVGTPVFIH